MRFYSSVTFVVMEIALFPLSLIEKIIHFFVLSLRLELVNKNSKERVVLLRAALYSHDF